MSLSVSNDNYTTLQSILYTNINVTTKTKSKEEKDKINSNVTTMPLESVTTKNIRKTFKTSFAFGTEASTTVRTNKSKQDARSIAKTDIDSSDSDTSKYIYTITGLSVIIVASALVLTAKKLVFKYENTTICFKLYLKKLALCFFGDKKKCKLK